MKFKRSAQIRDPIQTFGGFHSKQQESGVISDISNGPPGGLGLSDLQKIYI